MKRKEIDEEALEKAIKELYEDLVIVEGKKDKKALKSLGLKDIIAINGMPLYEVAEIALRAKKEIVILTDFDRKGREIERQLKTLLQRQGKIPNSKLRWKVMSLGKNKIEDLWQTDSPNSLSFREVDVHVKTSADFNKVCDKGGNRRTGRNRKT